MKLLISWIFLLWFYLKTFGKTLNFEQVHFQDLASRFLGLDSRVQYIFVKSLKSLKKNWSHVLIRKWQQIRSVCNTQFLKYTERGPNSLYIY